jgi:hypothetical protein
MIFVGNSYSEIGGTLNGFKNSFFGKEYKYREVRNYPSKTNPKETIHQFQAASLPFIEIITKNGMIIKETIIMPHGDVKSAAIVMALLMESSNKQIPHNETTNKIAECIRLNQEKDIRTKGYIVSVIPIKGVMTLVGISK